MACSWLNIWEEVLPLVVVVALVVILVPIRGLHEAAAQAPLYNALPRLASKQRFCIKI